LYEYDAGSWGPAEAERITVNLGGWVEPRIATDGVKPIA
jgi:hypothetical protein